MSNEPPARDRSQISDSNESAATAVRRGGAGNKQIAVMDKSFAMFESISRAGRGEPLRQQFGILAFAALTQAPTRIVVTTAAHIVQS